MSDIQKSWEKVQEVIKSLQAERDRLKEQLDYATAIIAVRNEEISSLKAEVEENAVSRSLFDKLEKSRDTWKAQAEKLAGALRDLLMHHCPVPDKDGNPIPYEANPEFAQAALDEYDQELSSPVWKRRKPISPE